MSRLNGKGVVGKVLKNDADNGLTICLCGVMARGEEQFAPILPELPGTVIAYHTEGGQHRFDNLITSVVSDICESAPVYSDIRIVGASLGGMEVPFVIERYLQLNPDVDTRAFHAVFVDAPSGLESLINPQAKFMKSSFVAAITAHLPAFIKVPVSDNALPKWDDITAPCEEDVEAYKIGVINDARRCMKGYRFSLLLDQTHQMIEMVEDGSLERACKSLEGVRSTYVRCTRSNDVVKPLAVRRWHEYVPHLEVVEVAGTHCGFLQNQPEFSEVFTKIFA